MNDTSLTFPGKTNNGVVRSVWFSAVQRADVLFKPRRNKIQRLRTVRREYSKISSNRIAPNIRRGTSVHWGKLTKIRKQVSRTLCAYLRINHPKTNVSRTQEG